MVTDRGSGMTRAREIVDSIATELHTVGRLEVVDELFRLEYVDHTPIPGFAGDRHGLKAFVEHLQDTLDEVVMTTDLFVHNGDWIAFRWRLRGHDPASILDDPEHGGEIDVSGNDILRLRGDRVAERWSASDLGRALGRPG